MADVDEFTCLIEDHPCADDLSRLVAQVLDVAFRKRGIAVGKSVPNTHPVWGNMREVMLACGLAIAESDGLYSQFTSEAKSWYERLKDAGFYAKGDGPTESPQPSATT